MNPVIAIKNIPKPTPRLIAYGFEPNNEKKDKPVKAVRRWPNITFLGCENGAYHTPKTRTILAPKDAISQGTFIKLVNDSKMKIHNIPPTQLMKESIKVNFEEV